MSQSFGCLLVLVLCLSAPYVGTLDLKFLPSLDFSYLEDLALHDICKDFPDACRNVTEVIRSRGYPCEDYTVETEDGFMLSVQRIPHGREGSQSKSPRPAVFLQHGLLMASFDWVSNYASNQSLPLLLADAGYDVWLGNSRGNTYSRSHATLKPSERAFWAFSFDQMAMYDLPAMINRVVEITGQDQVYYIGHSQGTLSAFAYLSINPKMAETIKMFIGLAPVAYVPNINGLLKYLDYIVPEARGLFYLLGFHEFLPNNFVIKLLAKYVCQTSASVLCDNVLFLISGYDSSNFNKTRLPVYLYHTPAGTSVQNIVHYSQLINSAKFQMYDFGSASKNMAHYGQNQPPQYSLAEFKIPSVLFTAGKDWLADPTDVERLISELPLVKDRIHIPEWNHLDFIWGIDATDKVYKKVIEYLDGGLQ